MPPRKATAPKQVKSTTHADKRTNIPTEELRDFVADDERNPIPVTYERPLLYPRDPDADPQLVWRGKDEQDADPLTVPAVPLYIQEKIDPRALVEDLRRVGAAGKPKEQLLLFEDFDGLEGYEQVEFYEHAANWSNRMVLGDALLVMNSMAEKERLRGQVQMIYMDPPYGIKFGSNWQVSTRKRDVKDGSDASRQPEQVKAFRDTWKDGIHSYLTYLRDRISVAHSLLANSGSLFIQIGDENVHLVRTLLDEVFGPDNFIALINFRSMNPLESGQIESVYDHIIWYARNKSEIKYRNLWTPKNSEGGSEFVFVDDAEGRTVRVTPAIREQLGDDYLKRLYKRSDLRSSGYTPSCTFPIEFDGRTWIPASGKSWRTNAEGIGRLISANRLFALGKTLYYKLYFSDFGYKSLENTWTDTAAGFSDPKVYVVQTNNKVIERCLLMTSDPGDLVVDPTCGSGTTAFVAEQWGRRWITIDTSRVALALARTRLMSARYPYYLLEDSAEGAAKEAELAGHHSARSDFGCDVRHGFVYRRVPHITLKSIAQHQRITTSSSRQDD